ncbi:MAG: ankyrin repeat domain-containing protein [Sinimarinibacterium flocculans]|uniref:ankyrin repeat domain-containing protein n=1 Tax=Sinimarinibacterium flocculans TaxID=985250 RepID=UPI003C369D03
MSGDERTDCSLEEQLTSAAGRGELARVRELIAAGVKVRYRGSLALRLACCEGHTEIVRLLVERDPSQLEGYSVALCDAAGRGHVRTVALLMQLGASAHARRDEALYLAAVNGHADAVRLLLDAGCRFDRHKAELVVEAAQESEPLSERRKRLEATIEVLRTYPGNADGDARAALASATVNRYRERDGQ